MIGVKEAPSPGCPLGDAPGKEERMRSPLTTTHFVGGGGPSGGAGPRGVVTWFAAVLLGSSVLAANPTWNFDGTPTGKVAPGWKSVSGTWQVVADPTAPSKPL